MHVIRLLAVSLAVSFAGEALAQCTKDTDCKGDRVCNQGECQSPALTPAMTPEPFPGSPPAEPAVAAPPAAAEVQPAAAPIDEASAEPVADPVAPPAEQHAVRASPGWATGAGIVGFSLAALGLTLALGSEATRGDNVPSMSMGAVAALVLAVGAPVVAGGGSSARGDERVRGSRGLRIGGWITYGVGLVLATSLLAVGLADEETVPPGIITVTGLVGAASLSFFAIDALVSSGQARSLGGEAEEAQRPAVSIAPVVTLSPDLRGGAAGHLGLAGQF